MAQNSPNWTMLLLGGGGLLSIVTFVTKGIIDQKQERIEHLNKRNQELDAQIKEEREKSQHLVTVLAEQLKNIDAGRLSPDDAVRFREIFNLLGGIENLQEGFNDCKCAAKWLQACKDRWIQKAYEQASRKYPALISKDKSRLFRGDLKRYLDWVYTCLHEHGHTFNLPLSNFVKSPAISSPHPYIYAVSCLIESNDWGELTSEQIAYLREVLIRLTENIRAEFIN